LIKVLDRLLMFLYSMAVGAASIVVLVAACGGFARSRLNAFVSDLAGGYPAVQTAAIVVSALALLISLRFFIVSVKPGGGPAPSINQRTDHGDIRISVETVENIALKAASRTRGVKDLRARVLPAESGLKITIRAFVDGETPIPALSEEMQRSVSEQIEEATGIPVSEVSVFIANVTPSPTAYRSRVE